MKKIFLAGMFLVLGAVNVFGLNLGSNITISDQNIKDASWHRASEDQEVEPGMSHGQAWDLEGFFLKGNTLSIVGGFDFVNGNGDYKSGDLFIDVDGDAVFGDIHGSSNGNKIVSNTFGYDYVLDFDFQTSQYSVFSIDENSKVVTTYYIQNQGSNPWQYSDGGTEIGRGIFNVESGLTDSDTGFAGGNHYLLDGIDLGFLGDDVDFTSHFTMGCGNDNLMGNGTTAPVPEPSTLFLLGAGLIGIVGFRKKAK